MGLSSNVGVVEVVAGESECWYELIGLETTKVAQ